MNRRSLASELAEYAELIHKLADVLWPLWSQKYRTREEFRLRSPEEELPADGRTPPVDCRCSWEPVVSRRTVRSTQPPSRRSLNGGRRK